jgi:hypothetical protein
VRGEGVPERMKGGLEIFVDVIEEIFKMEAGIGKQWVAVICRDCVTVFDPNGKYAAKCSSRPFESLSQVYADLFWILKL